MRCAAAAFRSAYFSLEPSLLAVGCLVIILLGAGIGQLEVHPPAVRQDKGVVPQVFCRLDVLLVSVGPVQLDLLPLVGDSVNPFFVAAQGDEVAV